MTHVKLNKKLDCLEPETIDLLKPFSFSTSFAEERLNLIFEKIYPEANNCKFKLHFDCTIDILDDISEGYWCRNLIESFENDRPLYCLDLKIYNIINNRLAELYPEIFKDFLMSTFSLFLRILFEFCKKYASINTDLCILTIDNISFGTHHTHGGIFVDRILCCVCFYESLGFKYNETCRITYGSFKDLIK